MMLYPAELPGQGKKLFLSSELFIILPNYDKFLSFYKSALLNLQSSNALPT